MSLFERINTKLIREKKEPLSDEEKLYRKTRDKKAKDLGYKSGSELERTVDRGIKAVDKKPGGRYPRKGYATGEPFQPDNNPATIKGTYDKKSGQFVKTPGTGKYEASGKSTLKGRLVKYPSMDKPFSSAVKTGEVERDVAKRLKTRLKYTAGTELGGDKGVDKFVSKVMKNQKGTIGTGTGKNSDLYKILKRDIENRNPTVPSDVINPKTGTRFRKPMPGGFDADGGRTGTKAQQARYDMTAQRRAKKFDKEIVKKANLPKGLKIPKGGETRIDPKTGIERASTELDPKELNVKYKAAKLKLDYGGRMAKRDPKYQGMTAAQKKANFDKLKKSIYDKKSSQPSKAPLSFSTYKYDRKNIVPTNLKGKAGGVNVPKFRDINKSIPFRQATRDAKKAIEKRGSTFTKSSLDRQLKRQPLKFAGIRKPTKAIKYKKTFGDFAKQAAKTGYKFAKNRPLTALAISGAAIGGGLLAKKFLGARGDLTPDDFTSSTIKDKSGKDVTFKYPTYSDTKAREDLKKKDPNVKLDPNKNYTDGTYNPKLMRGGQGFLSRKPNTKQKPLLSKFKSGEFKVTDKDNKTININDRLKNSAFEKQMQKAEKGTGRGINPFGKNFLKKYQTKQDKKFLKTFKNAARPT